MRASTTPCRDRSALAQATAERDQAIELADSLAALIQIVLAGADEVIGALRARLREAGVDDTPPAPSAPSPDQLARVAAGTRAIANPAEVLASAMTPGDGVR